MGRGLGARVHVLYAFEQRAFAGLIQPYQQQMELPLLCDTQHHTEFRV